METMKGKQKKAARGKITRDRPEELAHHPAAGRDQSPAELAAALHDPRANHPANAARSGQMAVQLQRKIGNQQAGKVVQDGKSGQPGRQLSEPARKELKARKGAGQALEPDVQQKMEAALGHQLDQVRVHTDGPADALNQQIGAAAFATGRDIFFRQGRYNPETPTGQHLLVHELTHVVQQSRGEVPTDEGQVRPAGDAFEQQANQVATAAIQQQLNPGTLQRQPLEEEEELLQTQSLEEEEELLQTQDEEELVMMQPLEEEEEEELLQPQEEEELVMMQPLEEEEEEELLQPQEEEELVMMQPLEEEEELLQPQEEEELVMMQPLEEEVAQVQDRIAARVAQSPAAPAPFFPAPIGQATGPEGKLTVPKPTESSTQQPDDIAQAPAEALKPRPEAPMGGLTGPAMIAQAPAEALKPKPNPNQKRRWVGYWGQP